MPTAVVTGAFGYTGRAVAARLLAAGWEVRTLTNHPDRDPFGGRVRAWPLDFARPDRLTEALAGADALLNTYWIRFPWGGLDHAEAVRRTRVLVAAARAAGVRLVHVSIAGASPASPLPYFWGKGLAEAAVQGSGLPYAILRPTLLFGGDDVLANNVAWLLRRVRVFPLFGDGAFPVQPVHVDDVAAVAVDALAGRLEGVVEVGGPERLSYRDWVATLAEAVGSRAWLVPAPPEVALALAAAAGLALGDVVVTRDEVRGLMAGLLVADGPPRGTTRWRAWALAEGPRLGARYASELARHYRA